MRFAIVTLFPEMFDAVSRYGITGRACRNGVLNLQCWNPRDFTEDKHRTVDDKPFGGGPGMLMKTRPLQQAIKAARTGLEASAASAEGKAPHASPRVIYLSPQGRRLDQAGVKELASRESFVLVCGRYQGIDQRVIDTEIDEEWSLGDFVLSGGELAAMVLIDAVTRYQPGALGDEDSAQQDSFAQGLLHSPEYTRPQLVNGIDVPAPLLSGNHAQIREWQLQQSLGITWLKRPDLLATLTLDTEQRRLLEEFINAHKISQPAADK